MAIAITQYVNFGGPEWAAMKQWLTEQKETKIGLLLAEESHDKSNQLRGAIYMINQLLRLEEAAKSTIGR